MITLQVNLGERSYPIHIGAGLLGQVELLMPHTSGRQVMVVSNDTIAPLYLEKLLTSLDGQQSESVILPDGEEFKNLEVLNTIFDALLKHRFDRNSVLIALGGGVVGDMTGFAAACYQRGVDFIQIPTTLLAQVDSSVGGKTGVNHARGKNMIGAFHQPLCVIADTQVLDTLDDRQLHAGIAEIIKYGLIRDAAFFSWLEDNMHDLMHRDAEALAYAIEQSCHNKAEIVAADEKESGIRALLNLGHTFGHAIETGLGYGVWLHGEAVAAGICMATDLSRRIGWLGSSDLARVTELIKMAHLPITSPAELDSERFMELMSVDKKVKAGKIRLVLLKAIGEAIISDDFDEALLRETLETCRRQ